MTDSLPDFDAIYAGRADTEWIDQVPWNIGEPQPAIAALIDAGRVSGEVLDAGCGVGETALYLAARGHSVVGLDLSPTAIDQARRAAEERGLTAEFAVADITSFTGYDGRFAAVIDSTLFHSIPVASRSPYLGAIAKASASGAVLHVLVFTKELGFPEGEGPNTVDEPELRAAVEEHWSVESVVPSSVEAILPPTIAASAPRDGRGRVQLPAFLLTARRKD